MIHYILVFSLGWILSTSNALAKITNPYQIGEEWNRIPSNGHLITDQALNNLIQATARIDARSRNGSGEEGSAFYLGKFKEKHLMMSGFHVMSNIHDCHGAKVYFKEGDERRIFQCNSIVAAIPIIDAVFFTIHVSKEDEAIFQNTALKFDFQHVYKPGEKLVTAGYGSYKNGKKQITYDNSSTCLVGTDTSRPYPITGRNQNNSLKFTAWSFVHTCEISPGDSGSALVSEVTGRVIGLNWATQSQKISAVTNSAIVLDWIANQNSMLWLYFSYGVPASSILSAIRELNNPILNDFINSNIMKILESVRAT